MKKIAFAVLALALPFAAEAQTVKPEDQIKLRKSAYALMGYNFASLAAMAQGKKPFNKDEAARNAQLVATLAPVPGQFFGNDTDFGETKAKPEIWKNRSDFDAKMEKMKREAAKLPQVAGAGDMGAFKKQVSDTGAACKSCHDDYREK